MRNNAASEKDTIPGIIPAAPWRIAVVEPLSDYRIRVCFVDGTQGVVDLSSLISAESAGVFESLRDPVVFAQASVEIGVVTWPGEIDLAPDAMYAEIKKHGVWRLCPSQA